MASTSSIEISIPGLKFPEGPRWRDDALWLSDQLGGCVYRVGESGDHEVIARIDSPSGLGFLPDGQLMVSVMSPPRVVIIGSNGSETSTDLTLVGAAHANDMYVGANGRAYVDVYGEDWSVGSLILVEDGAPPRSVADGLAFPNGVAITPDGSTLLVAETFAECISAFDVAADGSLSGRRVWAHVAGAHFDGLCLDSAGAVWVASYLEAEFLRVSEGGAVTDRIAVPGRWAMACALGGADGRTLYLCSAETSQEDYFAGRAVGHLDTHRVSVPGVERP